MFTEERYRLNGRAPGADHGHALVGEPCEPTVVVAAGVVIVPARGVEGVSVEVSDPGDARELRPVGGSGRLHDKPGADAVKAMRADMPALVVFVPPHLGHAGLEDGPVVQAEVFRNPLAVVEDLGRVGVLLLRHESRLLQERQVAVGLDVALRARVAVPVPRAAEVSAGFDDAEVGDAPLLQPRPRHQAAESGADDGDIDVQINRLPVEIRIGVGIVVGVMGEFGRRLDVLALAVLANALVPFGPVLLAQGARIEVEIREEVVQSLAFRCHRVFRSGVRH